MEDVYYREAYNTVEDVHYREAYNTVGDVYYREAYNTVGDVYYREAYNTVEDVYYREAYSTVGDVQYGGRRLLALSSWLTISSIFLRFFPVIDRQTILFRQVKHIAEYCFLT